MTIDQATSQIASDLRLLGINPGDSLLVHSSFKSLGPVPGGIETLIQGLLQAISESGTLLMPALSWALRPPQIFDQLHTPLNVGAIPEFFRTRPGTRRSLHPTHSVCALGPRTAEFLDSHPLDSTPCGPNSPFQKLPRLNGKILMLGCGLHPNTTMHALEEVAGTPFLGQTFLFTLKDASGNLTRKNYTTHGFTPQNLAQRYDRILHLDTPAFLREGKVLQAQTFVLDAANLQTAAVKKMHQDPLFFVEKLPPKPPQ